MPIAAALFNECIRGQTRGKVVMAYESVYVWGIFLAPLIGLTVGFLLMLATVWIFRRATPGRVDWIFRRMQLVSELQQSQVDLDGMLRP